METKICLVPTRTLFPQVKKERKTKPQKTISAKAKPFTKIYNEKDSSSYVRSTSSSSPQSEPDKMEHTFLCDFPRASDYSTLDSIARTFPHLKDVNKPTFQVDRYENMKCFIMRSNNEDDIHKAIKYGIWTSTTRSNEFLDSIYTECTPKDVPIFLLFSVVRSGQFSAVAQLNSNIKPKHFQFWWEDKKWLNHFEVKWIFVKDVPYRCFNQHMMDDNTPVIRARDCTSIPVNTAKDMLKIFRDYRSTTNILDAFYYMDVREDLMRHYRYSIQNYQNQISAKKNNKPTTPPIIGNSSNNAEPAGHFDSLLKEFEIMLNFYQREKDKLQEEIEDVLDLINGNHELPQDELEDLLPEYHDLKCREKELEEGLEELESAYQAISNEKGTAVAQDEVERNVTKLNELESVHQKLKQGFLKDRENMSFFSRKMLQLNVTFYRYTF